MGSYLIFEQRLEEILHPSSTTTFLKHHPVIAFIYDSFKFNSEHNLQPTEQGSEEYFSNKLKFVNRAIKETQSVRKKLSKPSSTIDYDLNRPYI